MIHLIFLLILIPIAVLNVLGNFKQNRLLVRASKPLLVPLIILFYAFGALTVNILLILGLTCGWFGDMFLLSRTTNQKAFLYGLLSFLIGHIVYIILFTTSVAIAFNWWLGFMILPYALMIPLMLKILGKDLGKMKIPTLVYMAVIMAMSYCALLRQPNMPPVPFWLTFSGSLLFILSDAILAIEHFKKKSIFNHSIVMATYIAAQVLIAAGFLAY